MQDSIANMAKSAPKMHGRHLIQIMPKFNDKLIGVVYNKFSENTTMRRPGEHACMVAVAVQNSLAFFG